MTQSVEQAIQSFNPQLPLAVALSGGADSVALLLACTRKWPGQVVALHINHDLQDAASVFEGHCRTVCQQLNVPLHVQKVDARNRAGESPEDAARQARYMAISALALAECAQCAIKSIAIAQHADDQVETVLLALSRGAGLPGLSAMPSRWERDGLHYYRPFLQVSGADIRKWLESQEVGYAEDPSNLDERYTRNRIRAQVTPVLRSAFPQFLDTFARSALHAAQAQLLLDELATQDCEQVCRNEDGLLEIKALQLLGRARQANLLRHWLKKTFCVIPSTAQLEELLNQIAACKTRAHHVDIKGGSGFVQRRGSRLTWYNP